MPPVPSRSPSWSTIREIQRRYRSTAVVISHDAKAGLEVADNVLLLHRGRVVEQGPKDRVRASTREITEQLIRGEIEGPLSIDR